MYRTSWTPAPSVTPTRPATPAEAAAMVTAAQRVVRSDDPASDLLAAAGDTAQLGDPEDRGAQKRWSPRVLDELGAGQPPVGARQRGRAPRVPVDAPELDGAACGRAAGLADRRAGERRDADAQLSRGRAALRRRLGVPRRDQHGRDGVRPDPRNFRGRGAGADAVHPDDLGHLRSGWRHRRPARRDPRRGTPAGGQRLRPRQGRRIGRYNNSWAYVRAITHHAG